MERVWFFFLWLAVVFVPAQNLCDAANRPEARVRGNNFTLFEENGKVGLKSDDGRVLIPAAYEALGWSNGKLLFIDGVVGYRLNGLWGLIHMSNKVVTSPEFLDVRPGEGSYLIAQKRSPLSQRRSFGVITVSGKVAIPFLYDDLRLSNMRAIVVSRTGTKFLFGLTDLSHHLLIPLKYRNIFSLGSLRFAVENFDGKIAIFSDDGSPLSPFEIDSISTFRKDYAVIYQNQRQGIIDRNGEVIAAPEYGDILIGNDGKIKVKETDSWFVVTGDNRVVRHHQADAVKPLSSVRYAVAQGGKYQLTNNDFQPLHSGYYASVSSLDDGRVLFRSQGRTGIMSADGKVLIPARYTELTFAEGLFCASIDTGYKNRWTLLGSNGNQLTEKLYEEIAPLDEGIFAVRNRGFWGAIEPSGKQVISCVHDSIVQRRGQHLVVKFKGGYGVIDLVENWVVTPQRNHIELLDDDLYLEFSGNTTFVKSLSGNIIYFSDNPLKFDGHMLREYLPSGACWTIDKNGLVIDRTSEPESVDSVFAESEGFRAISKDGKFGFVDLSGRLRIANRYEAVKPFKEGMAAIRIRDRWGFVDTRERLIVQPVYDRVGHYKNGYAIVVQNSLAGLVDRQGRLALPVRYDDIRMNEYQRFVLRQGKSVGLADASAAVVIHPRYDAVNDNGNGYVIAERNGKFGLLTLHGVSTVPMIYDSLTFDAHRNQYLALKRSSWKDFTPPASIQKQ